MKEKIIKKFALLLCRFADSIREFSEWLMWRFVWDEKLEKCLEQICEEWESHNATMEELTKKLECIAKDIQKK